MLKSIIKQVKTSHGSLRCCSNLKDASETKYKKFETVFSFPFIKYISVLNRLKVYQIIGTSIAIPGSAILESINALPPGALLSTSYIGVTGVAVLSLFTWPFKNTIGYLYISEDNETIKISSMDFWGRRKDKIVSVDEWKPILDMGPKKMDSIFLSPELTDGTKYKLFIKFGKVLNSKRIGQVLE